MTPAILSGTAAMLLSILATYAPKFNTWHAALSKEQKQLLWLSLLLLTALGSMVWTCEAKAGCIAVSWQDYLTTFLGALTAGIGANQGIHLLLPEPEAVAQAKVMGMLRRGKG
jgi:hypothetical protein